MKNSRNILVGNVTVTSTLAFRAQASDITVQRHIVLDRGRPCRLQGACLA